MAFPPEELEGADCHYLATYQRRPSRREAGTNGERGVEARTEDRPNPCTR
jgi:hypothetical protein